MSDSILSLSALPNAIERESDHIQQSFNQKSRRNVRESMPPSPISPDTGGIIWRSSSKTAPVPFSPGYKHGLRPSRCADRLSRRSRFSEAFSRLSAKRLKISSPKRRKLSTRAALTHIKREAVQAAQHAALQLDAGERYLAAAIQERDGLITAHEANMHSSSATLAMSASAHLDGAAYEAIRDSRLFNTLPAKTALVLRCTCVLLTTAAEAPPEPWSRATATAAVNAKVAKHPSRWARSSAQLQSAKDLMGMGESRLQQWFGQRNLREAIGNLRLDAVLARPEVVRFIARQADFTTSDVGAARARALHNGASTATASGMRAVSAVVKAKAKASTAAAAAAALFRERSEKAPAGSRGAANGGGYTRGQGQLSFNEATASTGAAGHLFRWIAHILSAVCKLADLERCMRPEIVASQAAVASAASQVAALRAAAARAKEAERASTVAIWQHEAEVRLKEAHERLQGYGHEKPIFDSAAPDVPGTYSPLAASAITSRTASACTTVHSSRCESPVASPGSSPAMVTPFHGDERSSESDEESEPDEIDKAASGPIEEHGTRAGLARKVAEFQRIHEEAQRALYKRVLADGGAILGSCSSYSRGGRARDATRECAQA